MMTEAINAAEHSQAPILVVDDSAAALAALGALLKPIARRLLLVQSGAEALALAELETFALALIDVQMPGMSGFELTRRIRKTDRGRVLPIMLMTALSCDEALIAEGYAAGAADFVTKPFDSEMLYARVCSFIELHEQQEAVNRARLLVATRERDEAVRRLLAFERISTAALETNDLQSLLHELLRIFIAAADVADSATFLLREGDNLEVCAYVGFDGAPAQSVRERLGTGFAGRIAAQRQPRELSIGDGLPEDLAELGAGGLAVVYGVPLISGGEVLGVAQIGSTRATAFTEMEKSLFRAAADRAALAVSRHLERSRLLEVLSAIPASVAIVRTPLFEYEFASPAYAALCGGELAGETLARRGLSNELLSAAESAFASRAAVQIEELSVFPAAGGSDPLCFRFTAQPLWNVQGEVDRVLLFAVDVTEQVLARQTIEVAQAERASLLAKERQARAEAEMASAVRDEFLTTISHELRAPLSAILGWAGAARGYPELQHALSVIERNARMQSRIIEDLLDFARIVRGKLRLDLHEVDLPELLAAGCESLRTQAEQQGVLLEHEAEPIGSIAGDGDRLQQVLLNLLGNALKFTPAGGKVTASLSRANGAVLLAVSDTGSGIEPEFLPHVFEPFRQADGTTTRRHRGLGLGLSIVQQIVQAHGGLVTAISEGRDRGTRIEVLLPSDGRVLTSVRRSKAPPPPGFQRLEASEQDEAATRLMSIRHE